MSSGSLAEARTSHDKWLEQAKRDLQAARSLEAAGHFEWACFVALQAVEKSLKGCLDAMDLRWEHYRGRDGHDLDRLLQLWPNFLRIDDPQLAAALTALNRSSEDTRYPSEKTDPETKQRMWDRFPWEMYEAEGSRAAIASAERLLQYFADFVSSKLPQLRLVMRPARDAPQAESP